MSMVRPSALLKPHVQRFARALRSLEHGEVRALHRARVESRRMRELIPMLPIDAAISRKLSKRLRKVTVRLGSVRELDVLLLLIDELHEARRPHSDALARVAIAVARDRDQARERLSERLPIDELERIARKLRALVDDLDGASPRGVKATRWAIDARIAHRADRLRATMRAAGAVYLPERLHAVRIAGKKLRYSLELADAIAGREHDAAIRTLRRAQDALGRMHDLQVLIDRVRQVQATLTPPSVSVWRSLDALVASLDDDCRRLHARFMRLRPELDAIVRRVEPRSESGTRELKGPIEPIEPKEPKEPATRNPVPRTRAAG
jgi:CHAD domain-containing protein